MKGSWVLRFILVGVLAASAAEARAQAAYSAAEIIPPRGIMPNTVQDSAVFDNIEVTQGKLSFQVPLVSLPPGPNGSAFGIIGTNAHMTLTDAFGRWPRTMRLVSTGGHCWANRDDPDATANAVGIATAARAKKVPSRKLFISSSLTISGLP
jgi:hypothetical protein